MKGLYWIPAPAPYRDTGFAGMTAQSATLVAHWFTVVYISRCPSDLTRCHYVVADRLVIGGGHRRVAADAAVAARTAGGRPSGRRAARPPAPVLRRRARCSDGGPLCRAAA